MNGKICVVIGGGNVAYRKVVTLIETGANIKVVSPVFIEPLLHFGKAGKIELRQKKYSVDDLKGAFIVFVAIGSKDIVKKIIEDAHARGALCNVVDD
ncbi:MAG: NAD(P)-dependent oxidoreductase [Deltaproteobacteria bacterium]|nr:NAD(P)-dependent oxidoreductase [Deltaproteobacteria bacterium]